ncbi:MAG TPA: hypothetical protein VF717_16950 [Pyrinomonadaceae bacterium]
MRKIRLSLLLSLVACFATGCPKYKPSVDFNDQNTFVNKVNAYLKARQTDYLNALARNDTATAKTIRNEVIELTLPYIDDAYMEYITSLQAGRDRSNFVADLIDLGTSAAVGITNGERSLQILGVALTAFRGGRRSADLNFFKEQTTPILISKMDGNRARVRAVILSREREEISTYPIGAALGDIVEYYNAGTLVRAFTELSKDTAVQTQQSEKRVLQLKGIDESQIFSIPPDAATDANTIGSLRNKYIDIFRGTDTALQNKATVELRNIYLEVATGARKDDFKPVIEEVKKDSALKALMEKLESGDTNKINEVAGQDILRIVSRILFAINSLKKTELISPYREIFVKHSSS